MLRYGITAVTIFTYFFEVIVYYILKSIAKVILFTELQELFSQSEQDIDIGKQAMDVFHTKQATFT